MPRNTSAITSRAAPPPSPTTLTITLLEPRSGTRTTKLLRLTAPVVRYQQRPIILYEGLLQLILRVLVHVFLVVCDDRLRNGLSDRVDLRCVTTARDPDADVNVGELVGAENQDRLVDL